MEQRSGKLVVTLRLEPNKVPVSSWNTSQNQVLKRIVTMVHYRTIKWVRQNSFTKIRTNSGAEMVSFGSHWPSEVVWHLCSQSESGRKMPFQLGNFHLAAKRRVLQKALCHLGVRIDNNWKWEVFLVSLSLNPVDISTIALFSFILFMYCYAQQTDQMLSWKDVFSVSV